MERVRQDDVFQDFTLQPEDRGVREERYGTTQQTRKGDGDAFYTVSPETEATVCSS